MNNVNYLLGLKRATFTQLEHSIGLARGFFYRSTHGDSVGMNTTIVVNVLNYFKEDFNISLDMLLFEDLEHIPFENLHVGDKFKTGAKDGSSSIFIKTEDNEATDLLNGKKKKFATNTKVAYEGTITKD